MVILKAWTSGPGEPADAAQALAAGQKKLQEGLLQIHRAKLEPFNHKIEQAEERKVRAEAMIEGVTENLRRLRDQSRKLGLALEPQDAQLFTFVKRENLAMRAELAGLRAQREAIVEQIARTKNTLEAAQKQGERLVLDELAAVLKLKEDELAGMQTLFKKGFVTQAQLAKGEVALAQAKADLVDRRHSLVQEAGGGQLGRLNEQLVDTQIAIITSQARREETERALRELEDSAYNPVNSLVINYQRTRRALENAWAEEEAAAADLAKLKRTVEAIPAPKVIVIGGGAKPK